jgi:hypothetical protein
MNPALHTHIRRRTVGNWQRNGGPAFGQLDVVPCLWTLAISGGPSSSACLNSRNICLWLLHAYTGTACMFTLGCRTTSLRTRIQHSLDPLLARRNMYSLNTLDPARLHKDDCIEFSSVQGRTFRVRPLLDSTVTLRFKSKTAAPAAPPAGSKPSKAQRVLRRVFQHFPFPEGTRGFLYYAPGPPHAPAAGGIRVRVTPRPEPDAFAEGHDLLDPATALPWTIPLAAIARMAGYGELLRVLRNRDGLVSPAVDERLRNLPRGDAPRKRQPCVHSFRQPFFIDWSVLNPKLWIASGDSVREVPFALPGNPRNRSEKSRTMPYTGLVPLLDCGSGRTLTSDLPGTALCALEPAKTDSGMAAVALRVLKILTPVQPVDPKYDGYVPAPEEGQLLRAGGGETWLIRLCEGKQSFEALRPLIDANAGYIEAHTRERYAKGTRLRRLQHLRPDLLVAHDFVDLSDKDSVRIAIDDGSEDDVMRFTYGGEGGNVPFPVGSRGFWYFHPGTGGSAAAHLRFRITDAADPAAFEAGHDLLLPSGLPWRQNVVPLVRGEDSRALVALLVREGLVPADDIAGWQALSKLRLSKTSDVLAPGVPFVLDLTAHSKIVYVVRGAQITSLQCHSPFTVIGDGECIAPYRGERASQRMPSPC